MRSSPIKEVGKVCSSAISRQQKLLPLQVSFCENCSGISPAAVWQQGNLLNLNDSDVLVRMEEVYASKLAFVFASIEI